MVTNCNLLAKPSNGAVTLADVREPTLAILCEPCGQRGRLTRVLTPSPARREAALLALGACPSSRGVFGTNLILFRS